MSAAKQLRLVGAPDLADRPASHDPSRVVFEHWLFMFGKSPNRCKLGPQRRRVINAALALYELEDVLLAIEGCAADEWCAGHNNLGREFTDVEWLLANESRIERFAEVGERLQERAAAQAKARAEQPVAASAEPDDPAAVQAARDALLARRALSRRLSGREE